MTEREMLVIKERVEDRLLEQPGVTGVGLTRKRVKGEFTDRLAIIVYVEAKRPLDAVPAAERIPSEIEGIPTDVVESPSTIIHAGTPDTAQYTVIKGGICLAGSGGGGGTLSFIAKTTQDYSRGAGLFVLVSCQHVMNAFQDLAPGSAHSMGQPEGHDCCESCDFCGRIIAHQRANSVLNDDLDGGTAELNPGVQWAPEVQDSPVSVPIAGIRTITWADVFPIPVWKRGQMSRRTDGLLTDPYVSGVVRKSGHVDSLGVEHKGPVLRRFKQSLRIEGFGFSQPGDSGAAILDNSNRVVGIVFGGGEMHAVACHIIAVESMLHVTVCTVANTPPGVQTVPASTPIKNARNMHGPPLPQVVSGDGDVLFRGDSRSLYHAVADTQGGREFLRRLLLHREEILKLARRPRVIAAWRRFGGAHVTAMLSRGVRAEEILVPETYKDRSASTCARELARTVKLYCSAALAVDMDPYLPYVEELAGKTVPELLAALRTLDVQAPQAI